MSAFIWSIPAEIPDWNNIHFKKAANMISGSKWGRFVFECEVTYLAKASYDNVNGDMRERHSVDKTF